LSEVIEYRGYQITVEHRRSGVKVTTTSSRGGFEMTTDPDITRRDQMIAEAKLAVDRLLSRQQPDTEQYRSP
jgi:hypothetical protein